MQDLKPIWSDTHKFVRLNCISAIFPIYILSEPSKVSFVICSEEC